MRRSTFKERMRILIIPLKKCGRLFWDAENRNESSIVLEFARNLKGKLQRSFFRRRAQSA